MLKMKIKNKISCSLCNKPLNNFNQHIIAVPKHISKEINVSGFVHYYCLSKHTNDLEYSKKEIDYTFDEIELNIDGSIKKYFQKFCNNELKVLIVGFGISYEIFYLSSKKFEVTGIDISSKAKELVLFNFKNLNLKAVFLTADILKFNDIKYKDYFDFVVDRFVFQNIPIKMRKSYSRKISSLLKPEGNLILKCLNSEKFIIKEGPPYTISKKILYSSFNKQFNFEFIKNDTKSGIIDISNKNEVYFFCNLKKMIL